MPALLGSGQAFTARLGGLPTFPNTPEGQRATPAIVPEP